MNAELAKTYEPAAVEAEAYRVWLEEKCFHADPAAPGEPYTIVIPPPNVTGALHLGHAINNTLQDILTRNHRMRGFNTLWIPGIDHAGIATQAVVEKQLREKENKSRHDVGREGLVERIWQWKEQYGNRIIEQLKRLGCSCDWDRTRFTLDEICAKAVRETFFKLFKDGLIYRGKRLVNWDIFLQTSISDDEIYHETVKTNLWHIQYPIEGTDKQMVVATTRPETMLGDTAVAVHSEDARWNWAIGKHVRLPLTGRLIPIIADDILVDPKFGTGVVKVTPAHDPNDYAVWQRHQGKPDQIDLINILNPDGTLNENAGAYKGMKRDAARKKVVADLGDLLLKEEPYETQVGHSDRSKTPVEPYLSDQWFVKMAPLAEPALEVVRDGTIKFFPERHAQQYLSWLGEKRDWPISRQLWWGHRIPVWYIEKTQPGPVLTILFNCGLDDRFYWPNGAESPFICMKDAEGDRVLQIISDLVAKRITKEEAVEKLPFKDKTLGAANVELMRFITRLDQDPDVLDTWFSSALWPHSTLGWPERTAELKKYYPTSVLLTGRDIITLWVARMVMMGMYNLGETKPSLPPGEGRGEGALGDKVDPVRSPPHPNPLPEGDGIRANGKQLGIPFFDVAINPTILDGHGERMSKSKGNGIDPVEIIDIYGADALRFTMTNMATETQDARMPVKKDAQGRNTSEKFDIGRNFCNKLWNAARFVLASLPPLPPGEGRGEGAHEIEKLDLPDRWIISRFNRTVTEADAALSAYRFDQYAKTCYDFFWRDFCDWYVETAKPALKNPATAAQTANVLAAMLDGALRLMHPMIPFITEIIWWKLNEVRPQRGLPGRIECPASQRLIRAAWPKGNSFDEEAETIFPRLQEIISAIRTLRNDYKVDLKRIVDSSIVAPGETAKQILANRAIIELLATCRLKAVAGDLKPVENAARTSAAGCDIFVEGVVDAVSEAQRINKRKDELIKQIGAFKGRLSNEGYMAKAPPKLVEETRSQLAAAEAELAKLG